MLEVKGQRSRLDGSSMRWRRSGVEVHFLVLITLNCYKQRDGRGDSRSVRCLSCASVVVQGNRDAVQLPPVGHVLLDARRRSLPPHHHRLCVQRVSASTVVLRRRRMG